MKKVIALVLAVIMVFTFASCGKKSNITKTDLDQPITIHWIMPGPGMQTDSEKVWAKVNEELHKIDDGRYKNVTLKIEVIPAADYSQKIMLMQTSGEPMDIIQTYSLNFAQQYRDGSFLDLTDYLEVAPEMVDELPDWVLDMGKVDGGQAIIPNYQKMVAAPYGLSLPKTLADEYADLDKMLETFQNADTFDDNCRAVVEEYLINVRNAGKIAKGYLSTPSKGTEQIVNPIAYDIYKDDIVCYCPQYSGESYVESAKWYRTLFEEGLIRKDVLSTKARDYEAVHGNGGGVAWNRQIWTGFEPEVYTLNDVEYVTVPLSNEYFIPFTPAAGGIAISSSSKYPDVAMEIINLMNSAKGTEIYNMMCFGIEGEHYTVEKILEDGCKKIKPVDYVEQGTSSAKYGLWNWVVGNQKNSYLTSNLPDNFKETVFEWQNEGENTKHSKLMGFAPIVDTIETKISQINAVNSEYSSVTLGAIEDVEGIITEQRAKLKAAGIEDVIAEVQSQVDEFLATK